MVERTVEFLLPPSLDAQETTIQKILQPVAKVNPKFLLLQIFLGTNAGDPNRMDRRR
jgi:hypothetical protein